MDFKNEFFDSAKHEHEVFGFFEELIAEDAGSGYGYTTLGTRRIAAPDRPIGSAGRIQITLSETLTLQKGHKTVTVKASPQKPIKCWALVYPLFGGKK